MVKNTHNRSTRVWLPVLVASLICVFATQSFAQGSLQRTVKISNDNGNTVTILTDTPTTAYSLYLPNSSNPQSGVASLLYGVGNGKLGWTSASAADSGRVLQLLYSGTNLVPRWASISNLGFAGSNEPIVTFAADNGSLSNNRVFSVGTGLSITNSGVDNGSLIVANTGVLKLTAGSGITLSDSTGNITITSTSATGWQLNGNGSTTPWDSAAAIGNFLGTTDGSDLILGTGATLATRAKLRIYAGSNNILLARRGAQLQFRGTTGTGITTLEAGAQGNTDINYIFPITKPSISGQALVATTAGQMSWVTLGQGDVDGSGTATRIAFWGPGPGVTNQIEDDTNLYWDNANKRLSVGAGDAPGSTLDVATSGSTGANSSGASLTNNATSTTSNINKSGLTVSSTGTWSGSSTINTGLSVTVSGAATNYSGLFSGGNFGIGTTTPSQLLEVKDGNFLLSNSSGTASGLQLQGTGSGKTIFQAGGQGATNITYTLPIVAPSANGQVLSASTGGTLSWITPGNGSGLTGTGTATRVVFWGPGPNSTTNLMDDSNFYWDNTNKRVGIGTTTPTQSLDIKNGNFILSNNNGTAGQLRLQGTGTGYTSFLAGAQGATNLAYILPTAYPTSNNQVLASSTTGTMSWVTPSGSGGGVTGSGVATRIAFWGPGPGQTSNLQDDSSLYWDNTNKRLSVGAGTSPTATLHSTLSGSQTTSGTTGLFANTATSSTAGITKYGLDVQSTGSWTGSSAVNTGLNVNVSGGTTNYAALFNGGNVGIGYSSPGTQLHVRTTDAVTNTRSNVLTIDHNTSGTVGNYFGSNILFQLQTTAALAASGAMRDAASISAMWTNATDASRTSAIAFNTVNSAGALTEKVRISPSGVGINTGGDINVQLDINGGYATRQKTLTLSNGRNDNIDIGDYSFVRIVGPTAPFSISGICCGTDGKRCRIANMTGQDWTIMDSSSSSTLGNRIETNTNSDVTVKGPVPVLDMIYDSASNQWLLGTLNANQVIGAIGSIVYVYKTADESVTSSATIQDDDHISFSLNAYETWELNGELQADNVSNNVDIKIAWQFPAGATARFYVTGIQDAGGNAIQGNGLITGSNTPKTIQINSGVSSLISVRGIIKMGSTSGTLKLRWAQGTANLSTTTLRAYSYAKIIRVN